MMSSVEVIESISFIFLDSLPLYEYDGQKQLTYGAFCNAWLERRDRERETP